MRSVTCRLSHAGTQSAHDCSCRQMAMSGTPERNACQHTCAMMLAISASSRDSPEWFLLKWLISSCVMMYSCPRSLVPCAPTTTCTAQACVMSTCASVPRAGASEMGLAHGCAVAAVAATTPTKFYIPCLKSDISEYSTFSELFKGAAPGTAQGPPHSHLLDPRPSTMA
jgi:hypothetical protein